MNVRSPTVVDRPPTPFPIATVHEHPSACNTTPDQYWNQCDNTNHSTLCRPCHARTTSRQAHDALGEQAIFALHEPQRKIDLMQVQSSRKRLAIQHYERNTQQAYQGQRKLLSRALKSGLEVDRIVVTLQSGGNDRSTLGLYPMKDIEALAGPRSYLENIYPTRYPMNEQKRRSADVEPFIPDNMIDERRLLRYLKIPEDGVGATVLEDMFDFDAACEDDANQTNQDKPTSDVDKSKEDTPMRDLTAVVSKCQDEEERAEVHMEH